MPNLFHITLNYIKQLPIQIDESFHSNLLIHIILLQMTKKKRSNKTGQIEFAGVSGHGGRRRGAGRPNLLGRLNHMKRADVDLKKPLHITMKLNKRFSSLRTKGFHRGFKKILLRAREFQLYVVHYSIQSNHIHMIVEAKSNLALGSGMRSLAGRISRLVRGRNEGARAGAEAGSVFRDRYHLHVLRTPSEMKTALAYVLLNTAKHLNLIEHIDGYSSGMFFPQWQKLLGGKFRGLIARTVKDLEKTIEFRLGTCEELNSPQSWLLQRGWTRA